MTNGGTLVVVVAMAEIQGAALWWCIERTTESTMNRVWKWRAEAVREVAGKRALCTSSPKQIQLLVEIELFED